MLSLVDYGASDSGEESENSGSEEYVHAEVIANPKKGINVIDNQEHNEDDYFGSASSTQDTATAAETATALIPGEGATVLAALPSVVSSERRRDSDKLDDAELEDIVKRKEWEVKLAEKAERKRRRKERKAKKKEAKERKKSEGKGSEKKPKKKKARIEAFGGLTALGGDSDEEPAPGQAKPERPAASKSASNSLLSLLPQPKSETRSESKGANILLPSAVRANRQRAKQETKPEIAKPKAVVADEVSDDSDVDSSDFFGLKSTSSVPLPPREQIPTVMSDISYGPSRPALRPNQDTSAEDTYVTTGDSSISNEGPSTSGRIDDSVAQQMIYAHDVASWGGAQEVAAQAVDGMVDVSVDQALGPNVQANLLKNLHNKSLAEAAISHLSAIPKAKGPADMVARRKHQITYLANVAVSREEQLAEQWSQNRHMKRVSYQKYGF